MDNTFLLPFADHTISMYTIPPLPPSRGLGLAVLGPGSPGSWVRVPPRTNPTLGANKGYALKLINFIFKNHTLLSTTKCRVVLTSDSQLTTPPRPRIKLEANANANGGCSSWINNT